MLLPWAYYGAFALMVACFKGPETAESYRWGLRRWDIPHIHRDGIEIWYVPTALEHEALVTTHT